MKVTHNLVVELGPKLPIHLAHLLAGQRGGRIHPRAAPYGGFRKLSPKRRAVLGLERAKDPLHGLGVADKRHGLGLAEPHAANKAMTPSPKAPKRK